MSQFNYRSSSDGAFLAFKKCVGSVLLLIALSGCTAYQMNGKTFYSQQKALVAFDRLLDTQLGDIPTYPKAGGSVLIDLPSDRELCSAPFITGVATPAMQQYFIEFYKRDFGGVQQALQNTGSFDQVALMSVETDIYEFAHANGFDCVLKNLADGSWSFSNPNHSKEIIVRPETMGLAPLVKAICTDAPRAMVFFKVLQN